MRPPPPRAPKRCPAGCAPSLTPCGDEVWECPGCRRRWREPIPAVIPATRQRKAPPRGLGADVAGLEVLDCDCQPLVPECTWRGGKGCAEYQRSLRRRRKEERGKCRCRLGVCDHIRQLVPHEVCLEEWGDLLEGRLPDAGAGGQDGYAASSDPLEPTAEEPGSPEKERVLIERVRRRESVARCGDAWRDAGGSEIGGLYARAGAGGMDLEDMPPPLEDAEVTRAADREQVLEEALEHGRRVVEALEAKQKAKKQGGGECELSLCSREIASCRSIPASCAATAGRNRGW